MTDNFNTYTNRIDSEAWRELCVSKGEFVTIENYNLSKIQVLTPMQRGEVGAANLNTELQAGNPVEYDVTELDELTLAYAVTIHKSRGSEFPVVVLPMSMSHYVMLQRNLIYTGITIAKKICVLVGSPKTLNIAVKKQTVSDCNTKLKERLK